MRAPKWQFAAAIASVVATASCASINIDALPQPGDGRRDGYNITIEFDNVLNLPDRAKVVMDGTNVGVVTNLAIDTRYVDVTAQIDPGVKIPSDVHAALQQATVLGDIYVSLTRTQDGQSAPRPLGPGGRIPLTSTTSPPRLEDTIANLANFVSSGSIQRMQNTVVGLNHVTPQGDSARAIASRVATDLSDLSGNLDTVDQLLTGVSQTAQVLHDRIPAYQDFFSPKGMLGFDRMTTSVAFIATLYPSVGSVYSNGYWLAPLLNSLADATGAMQRDKRAFEAEVPAWRRLFYEDFMAADKYPAMNITSVVGPDGRELSGNLQDVLRILGATP